MAEIREFDNQGLQPLATSGDVVILVAEENLHARRIPTTRIVIVGRDPGGLEARLKRLLEAEEIKDVARWMSTSRSTVQRARQALGIARRYTGDSRTTQWRREREKGDTDA